MRRIRIPVKVVKRMDEEKTISIKERNEPDKKRSSARTIAMFVCNYIIYLAIYVVALVFSWEFLQTATENALTVFAKGVLVVFFLAVAVLMFVSMLESWKDTPKDVQNHFNTNMNLIALLVALIALCRGGCGC